MNKMDSLYNILQEFYLIYENFLELGNEKYDAVLKDDTNRLDEVVAAEQAVYLKVRGLEQKLDKLTVELNMKDKSLKEIIISADDNRSVLIEEWNRLSLLLENVKKVNKLCSTMIEVRLHRVDKAIDKLGQKDNSYFRMENYKQFNFLSKKI